MPDAKHRDIYARTPDGGVQLASSTDRWHLYDDHVDLAPSRKGDPKLRRFDAELMPFVDSLDRGALLVIDMQNDFCAPGGWTDASGLDYNACREAIPGVQRAVKAAHAHGMWVVWVYWSNREDLRNLGAPTLYAFKHKPSQKGIGEPLGKGRVLTEETWNSAMVDELKPLIRDEDVRIEKVRMNGFIGTHLDQVLRTQGISTLYFAGVNVDQCVATTMEEACFRDYNCVLLEDACATSSPDYCKQSVVFNAKQCWGFCTTTAKFAAPDPVRARGVTSDDATATAVAAGGFGARLKRLGSESLVYGLSSIVGRLLGYLLQPYYAHQFDPAQNGIQSVVYSYIPIISIALYLGMDVAYMRNAASVRNASMQEQQRAFSASFAMVLFVGGAIAATLFAAAPWLAPHVRLGVVPFRFMLAIVFGDALMAVPFAHLRMSNRAFRYASIQLAYIVTSIALNIILIGHLHWGVTGVFVANVLGNVLELFLFVPDIARFFRPRLLRGVHWRPLWAYALPIMPAMLAVMLVENGDRIVLNYLPETVARAMYGMTSKDVVGIYSFNYKLGVAMLLVVQMFRMAWTPFSLQQARQRGAPQLFSRVLTALMLACSVVFLGVSVLLPSLVQVPAVMHYVKPAYWSGLPIVPVILLAYVFSGMYAVVTAGLYIERRTRVLPWIAGAGAVLNIAMCIVAMSRWGMVGVAWATPASYALMAALGAWQSGRVYPVPFEWRRLAHLGFIVVLLFAADRWFAARGVPALSAEGLLVKVAILLAFPALLFVTRFFRHGELQVLRGLLSGRAVPAT